MKNLDVIVKDYENKKPEELYNWDVIEKESQCVVADRTVMVTDEIARRLLVDEKLQKIETVTSPKEYIVWHETDRETEDITRQEEWFAIKLCGRENFGAVDEFLDYQLPIKRIYRGSGYGKVDLAAICREKKEIYLCELKKPESKETLLRCVTEIYTYFKQIDGRKLVDEIAKKNKCDADFTVVPAVLVFAGGFQHKQYLSSYHTNVKKLMEKLGVRTFIIETQGKTDIKTLKDIEICVETCDIKDITK